MARSRNIKPGFFTNDQLAELPALTRLLFIGLWTVADREGRIEDRPKRIKAETMPYDNFDCDEALSDLQKAGFITRYEAGGISVIQVVNWDKHQNPHVKEQPSSLPAQYKHQTSTVQEHGKEQPKPEVAGLIPDSGFLIPDSSPLIPSSVPNGTGDKSPEQMTKDELWSAGKSLLSASMPAKQCGSFVGKLVKDYGDAIVIDAVRAAVVARPADPAEYLKATCQHAAGLRQRKQPVSFAQQDELARRKRWEEMTGRKWPESEEVPAFIDIETKTAQELPQ